MKKDEENEKSKHEKTGSCRGADRFGRRRVELVNRRGLHDCPETVVAQRVHLAASGAEMFQFLLSRELSLFLIVFLVTHMFPFFSARSFRARFFIERYEKSPSRRAREPLCIFRRYDSITLLFGSIRDFRQGLSFFSIRHEFM